MNSILIVDQSFALRESASRSLRRRGWESHTVGNAKEGREAIRRLAYDVVVVNFSLPSPGAEWFWMEAVMVRPELRGRFLFVATEPLPEIPTRLTELEHFLVGPFSVDTLAREAERFRGWSGLRREGTTRGNGRLADAGTTRAQDSLEA